MFEYKSIVEGKGGITAKVVARSVHNNGPVLTTLELRYPRFIHSEFMTHRVFSRNAASSRAIPVAKMLEQVRNDPAMPIHWGKNQPGMQAREEHDAEVYIRSADWTCPSAEAWRFAASRAADMAENFMQAGYHKQIVNRLLEPFQFIVVIVTATEWDNFFKLRLHADAQPEMQELARVMKDAMDSVEPDNLGYVEAHLPYITAEDREHVSYYADLYKVSTARCARVSYLTHDRENSDVEKDMELHDKLLTAGHLSPFEHVAWPNGYDIPALASNFVGWTQYRKYVE